MTNQLLRVALEEREKAIVSRLVAAYRAGDLSDREAVLGIGEIATLRGVAAQVEREINRLENRNE